jgi:iron complex outermembrane receptor protein
MQPSRIARAIALVLAPLAVTAPALAADSILLEEVVVSAQKREQNIQDVGISIAAFTGDQLDAMGVQSSYDVAAFTPGVHISGALAGQNSQFTIRGVTQSDFNDVVEAPNAVYLDEGYIPIANAQTFGLFDIERVEVLKGPQGTLFGRNATGGLVHYISRKPNFEKVEGFVDLTAGYYDSEAHGWSQRIEAAVGGPISDNVAARVSGMFDNVGDYLKNIYPSQASPGIGLGTGSPGAGAGADMGSNKTYALRGTIDFKPSDDGLIRLSVNHAKSKVSTGPYQSISTIGVLDAQGELVNVIKTPAGETRLSIKGNGDGGGNMIDGSSFIPGGGLGIAARPVAGGDFFGYIDPDGAGWTTSSDFAFKDHGETKATGINGRVEWNLTDDIELVSITDWKNYKKSLFIDVDSAPVNQLGNSGAVDANSFSQELRVAGKTDRMRWVTGAYYLQINNDSDNALKAPVNSIIYTLFGDTPFDIGVKAKLKTKSYSAFGQVEYDVAEKVSLTLGGRIIKEKKNYAMLANGFFISTGNFGINVGNPLPNVPLPGAPFSYSKKTSSTLWTGKLQLDFRPYDGLLIYAGLNRGSKAGSFNAPLLGAYLGGGGDAGLPYKDETLWSYEAGFKASLGERTRLNGAVYYYDYKDSQAFLFVGVGGVVINADARTYGAELELAMNPIDGLDISLSGSLLDSKVKDVPLRAGSPLAPRDVRPTYTPEFSATGLVRYSWPALGGNMSVRADGVYVGNFYYNLRNFDADKFPSYFLLNAGIGWASEDNAWNLSLDVRNLTDKKAGVMGYDLASLCGCNEVSYHPPRWFGVSIKRSF